LQADISLQQGAMVLLYTMLISGQMDHSMRKINISGLAFLCLLVFSQSHAGPISPEQEVFFAALATNCGKAFAGDVVSEDKMILGEGQHVVHFRECSDDELLLSYNVGENRSRTWVISKTKHGLRLKHIHRHQDGSLDTLTYYGGDSNHAGTATKQYFPADDYSKKLFRDNDRAVSVDNTWSIGIVEGETYSYRLQRDQVDVQIDFDLSKQTDIPENSWGLDSPTPQP